MRLTWGGEAPMDCRPAHGWLVWPAGYARNRPRFTFHPEEEEVAAAMKDKRKYQKTHMTRPRKKGSAKNRRRLEQKRRLVALGMDEAAVAKLTSRQVLDLLKRPAKVAKQFQVAN